MVVFASMMDYATSSMPSALAVCSARATNSWTRVGACQGVYHYWLLPATFQSRQAMVLRVQFGSGG